MKILIIGASGMLAKPVIAQLDKAGFQLRLFSRSVNASMFDKTFEIVQGNLFNPNDLQKAMQGCNAVHVSLSNLNEALAMQSIIATAKQFEIKLISMISGCTVAEENRWFELIDHKFMAEQKLIQSGIPYLVFRPTWFFESLDLMVRNGKATMLGQQPKPYHWVAATDYAKMVAVAYQKPETWNKILFVFGPEKFLMKDLLVDYCTCRYPEIRSVSTVPLGLLKMIAMLTRNNELKSAASMFAYFEKVGEMGNPEEANRLLGKPETTFEKWVQQSNSAYR